MTDVRASSPPPSLSVPPRRHGRSRRGPAPAGHLPALDGLRGLAVAGVLLFHTDHLSGGFLGVDLFFVLSGFLITGLILREIRHRGGVDLRQFWARRIRRLFPALAVVLTVVGLAVWSLQRIGRPAVDDDLVVSTLTDGPWVQLHLANWHLLAVDASYWATFDQQRVFGHLWSIAVEEQFYMVWPLLVLGLAALPALSGPRIGARPRRLDADAAVLVAALLGAAVSTVLMATLVDPSDPTRVYTGTDTRAASLLLGAAAATRPARRTTARLLSRLGRGGPVLATMLLVGILAAWFLVEGTSTPGLFTGGLVLHAAASALLIALCAELGGPDETPAVERGHGASLLNSGLGLAPLRRLGEISYGLYLWHWPIIVILTPATTGVDGWAHTALVLGLSLAAATLSKRLIEDPVRHRARWARGRRGMLVGGLVTVALFALWFLLPEPAGPEIDVSTL